jgi:tRNA(adenine34) deaminase
MTEAGLCMDPPHQQLAPGTTATRSAQVLTAVTDISGDGRLRAVRSSTADERAMRLALAVAARALPGGDVPVGAVVLDPRGVVIGEGFNRREADGDPTAHAELLALRAAAQAVGQWRLSGCTLVVTLEPCTMCAGAIVLSRVDRVVFGAYDPKAGAVGSLWDVVRDPRLNHRPEVVAGVLAEECARVLQDFFEAQRG